MQAADMVPTAVLSHVHAEGDASGCHVSLKEFTSAEEACRYVQAIELCRPPDQPFLQADGGDGPENQKVCCLTETTRYHVWAPSPLSAT